MLTKDIYLKRLVLIHELSAAKHNSIDAAGRQYNCYCVGIVDVVTDVHKLTDEGHDTNI